MTDERQATRSRPPTEPCLNCGDTTPGRFCPACGQRKLEVLVSVRTLLADVLEDQLVLNRALPRTLGALLFRPGFLTSEYVRGRIVRYIAPFRLYLVSSVVFFLILSFVGLRSMQLDMQVGPDGDAVPADSAAITAGDITAADSAAIQGERVTTADSTIAAGDATPADSAAITAGTRAEVTDSAQAGALPIGTRQPWARDIGFSNTLPIFRPALERKLGQVGHLPLQDAIRTLLGDLAEFAPHMVFLLLPLFTGLLKLLYIRRNRFYAEHFIFALHVHAFVFVMFTLMFLLPWDQLDLILLTWIVTYVWLALKRVYGQGWVRTTLKWWTLGWLYGWLLLFGLIGLAIAALLLT